MTMILGHKLGMTRIFKDNGQSIPVTLIEVNPCIVTGVKTVEKDGYSAVQIGSGKAKHPNKPQIGQNKEIGFVPQDIKEYRTDEIDGIEVGKEISCADFAIGSKLKLVGQSKGKGFAGVIKRHNFSRGPQTHGSDHHRATGSIGTMFPQHVMKDKRMPGRMGDKRITVAGVEIVDIIAEQNIFAVKGAVPGSRGTLVALSTME